MGDRWGGGHDDESTGPEGRSGLVTAAHARIWARVYPDAVMQEKETERNIFFHASKSD